jgi:hypothetical protein
MDTTIMKILSASLSIFLLVACGRGSDSEINSDFLVQTWKIQIATEEGSDVGTGYYVFDPPGIDGSGQCYQVTSDASGLNVFGSEYRIVSTFNSGRVVHFEEGSMAGWIPVEFEIIGDVANQALIRNRAYNKVFDIDEIDRIRQAILEQLADD